jgi:hypothetical protein
LQLSIDWDELILSVKYTEEKFVDTFAMLATYQAVHGTTEAFSALIIDAIILL